MLGASFAKLQLGWKSTSFYVHHNGSLFLTFIFLPVQDLIRRRLDEEQKQLEALQQQLEQEQAMVSVSIFIDSCLYYF